jgi:hypothetical protein
MQGDEHDRTLSGLDPEYRKNLEDHWRILEENQDDDDRMVSATMKAHGQCARAKKPARGTIKQRLTTMIDRLLGKSHG